jgi:hypothetical protein
MIAFCPPLASYALWSYLLQIEPPMWLPIIKLVESRSRYEHE